MPLAPRITSRFAPGAWGAAAVTAFLWLAGCMATAESTARGLAPAPFPADPTGSERVLLGLEARARSLGSSAERIEAHYARRIAPIEAILSGSPFARPENEELRKRIAVALDQEASARGLNAELLASVLLVENPWFDLDRRSPVGAVGLMQVMPFHAGEWDCGSDDLEDLRVNICHGAGVFARDLKRSRGNLDRALLRYNGCVRGTNTPDCRSYPTKVFAQAGRAQMSVRRRIPRTAYSSSEETRLYR